MTPLSNHDLQIVMIWDAGLHLILDILITRTKRKDQPLETSEGSVTIPYSIQQSNRYRIKTQVHNLDKHLIVYTG
ncbi:MAG: hypothetical protein DLM72_00645 [Candidatus Nitrosopolaris wilkensis]|nr:MAG: hypothetical protein DLM72_00645 [Candidatus Nitrosopolaris wilkensis]